MVLFLYFSIYNDTDRIQTDIAYAIIFIFSRSAKSPKKKIVKIKMIKNGIKAANMSNRPFYA